MFMLAGFFTPENSVEAEDIPPLQKEGIRFFQGSWDEVLEQARAEKKIIFVDAYASWCGPCKWMSREVFPNEKVGDFYNGNFINYKFNMEIGEGKRFAKKYRLRAYPTLYFIDADEKVVHKNVGAKDVPGLLKLGKKALQKK